MVFPSQKQRYGCLPAGRFIMILLFLTFLLGYQKYPYKLIDNIYLSDNISEYTNM